MPGKKSTVEARTNDRWAAAEAAGYQLGANKTRDSLRNQNKYTDKVQKDHATTISLYVAWWKGKIKAEEGEDLTPSAVEARVLGKKVPAPDITLLKDFFRWYGLTSTGRITAPDGTVRKHASAESIKSEAERFFTKFTLQTETPILADDKTEVYWWLKHVLPTEGFIFDDCKPKFNFSKEDLDKILLAVWTGEDLGKVSERERVEFAFLLHTYCWTGARIGTFFYGGGRGGLRYHDIHLVLRRSSSAVGYELIWKIDQRWVKGNRNPDTWVFSTTGKEHSRLLYNSGTLLLALAFADRALFGYDSLDDLWQQKVPLGDNEVNLRWNQSVLELRPAMMSQAKFRRILKSALDASGYVNAHPSVHQIRRYLGKKVDERYTEVERSQHILHADPRIFGQSYVANCSSVDGQAAFLNEKADHTTVEYFQGLGQFRERGAPAFLPSAIEDGLENDPEVLELKARQAAAGIGESSEATNAIRSLITRLKRKARISYRERWMRERRDWKILTRGKISPDIESNDNQLNLILPERSRISEKMKNTEPLQEPDKREATQDLYTLITRDPTVFYRPGEEPIDGLCPVCGDNLAQSQKRYRSTHIHTCRKREKARQLDRQPSDLEYCFDCTQWYVRGEEWELHCQEHLSRLSSKLCSSRTYCSTLIRPAFCPSCLGTDLSPSMKMQAWDRDSDVLTHLEKVHGTESCLHPLCEDVKFENEKSFFYHQSDVHGFRRANRTSRKRKRSPMDTQDDSFVKPDCMDLLDNRDEKNAVTESLDEFFSQCIDLPPSPGPSINDEELQLGTAVVEPKPVNTPQCPSPPCSLPCDDVHVDTATTEPRVDHISQYSSPPTDLPINCDALHATIERNSAITSQGSSSSTNFSFSNDEAPLIPTATTGCETVAPLSPLNGGDTLLATPCAKPPKVRIILRVGQQTGKGTRRQQTKKRRGGHYKSHT